MLVICEHSQGIAGAGRLSKCVEARRRAAHPGSERVYGGLIDFRRGRMCKNRQETPSAFDSQPAPHQTLPAASKIFTKCLYFPTELKYTSF